MSFPIDRAQYRLLARDFTGTVVTADIDRTYLATRFSSFRKLVRIPFEGPSEKIDIEGMARLLREIRNGPTAKPRATPLYFVSASPAQLRGVIERKMMLDGIEFDGTTFKDWLGVVRRGRLSRLREQVGFKLTALFASRAQLPTGATEVLIGDDLESDALSYALYADVLSGRLEGARLCAQLVDSGVLLTDAEAIVSMAEGCAGSRPVSQVLIRLERHSNSDAFLEYGPLLLGCFGAFQMAVVLWKRGEVTRDAIFRVAGDLRIRGVSAQTVAFRLRDLYRRSLISPDEAVELGRELAQRRLSADLAGDFGEIDERWRKRQARPAFAWAPRSLALG